MVKHDSKDTETESALHIAKRGKPGSTFTIRDLITLIGMHAMSARNVRSPPAGELFQTPRGSCVPRLGFETQSSDYSNLTVGASPIRLTDKGKYRQIDGQPMAATEHPVDKSYIRRFIENARLGIRPVQGPSRVPAIPDFYWKGVWQRSSTQ